MGIDEGTYSGFSLEEAAVAAKIISRLADLPSIRAEGEKLNLLALASRIYSARRDRRHFFPEDLFSDPAWDILLILYYYEGRRERLSVSAVCAASDVPQTTALRWLAVLGKIGLVEKTPHPDDRRSFHVRLTVSGREKLAAYLRRVGERYFSCTPLCLPE